MGTWVDRFGLKLLDASFAVTLLTGVFALAMVVSRQPARRISLARAAIVGALMIIPLSIFAPLPRIELRQLFEIPVLKDHPLLSVFDARPSTPARGRPELTLRPWVAKATRLIRESHVSRIIIFLYLFGASCTLSWLLFGYWGIGWLTRRSKAPSAEALDLYNSVVGAWDGKRPPALRITSRVKRPVLLGLFRETILIPESYDDPAMLEQLRLSLLHELAHSQGRDPWFSLASELAQALWFFAPAVWWIRTQMRLDQEFLADRHAASSFGPNSSYASSLVNLAAPPKTAGVGPSPSALKAAAPTTGSALVQRILMLIQCPFPVESRPPGWWTGLLACLLIIGTLTTSSLSLQIKRPATLAVGPNTKAKSGSCKFTISRLSVKSDPKVSRNRNSVLELPYRLPDQFRLELDIWGDQDSLGKINIVGQSLRLHHPVLNQAAAIEDWHHVRVQRDEHGISVRVDGQPIAVDPSSPMPRWLSIEIPPNSVAHIENLIVAPLVITNLPF